MSIYLYIPIAIAAIILIYVIYAYNKGIGLQNYVKEAFATMDVYLKKRWDLIPKLTESVKGVSQFESGTFQKIAAAREQAYSGMSEKQKLQANQELGYIAPSLIALAENYPNLRANESYLKLMDGLTKLEDEIAKTRKYYNGTVRELNTFLELFPTNILGNIFGMKKADYFQIDESSRADVLIDIDSK